ncbi:hypothetical protein [Halorhodospira abdelmalekii]|uniref:hypothetical protein n=1 Tax=Halorhodospira abdelmalekii TaxID=421629 RepID=UPI0019050A34|nr:hypothetical protein [Halorhodospira abdelmalekii]
MSKFASKSAAAVAALFCMVLLGGCSSDGNASATGQSNTATLFTVETVVSELQSPWGLVFLNDSPTLALVTEKPGQLNLVDIAEGTMNYSRQAYAMA